MRTRPQPDPDGRLLLTINEAAAVLSIGRRTVYKLIADGDLTLIKVGSASRIRYDELTRYVAQQAKAAS